MHPIERMRYVARSSGVDNGMFAREAAESLAGFCNDPAMLVTCCRRLLARHPTNGALWWLAGHVLLADDPAQAAYDAADALDDDTTAYTLARALPDDARICVLGWPELIGDALPSRGDLYVLVVDAGGIGSAFVSRLLRSDVVAEDVGRDGLGAAAADADLVILEAAAVGPSAFVAPAGSRAAAAVAHEAGRTVCLVAGVGRLMPGRVFDAIAGRLEVAGEPWDQAEEQVPLDLVDAIVGPSAVEPVPEALRRTDCPVAPELLRAT